MKTIKIVRLVLPVLVLFLFLAGCNREDPSAAARSTDVATPQMLTNGSSAIYCHECQNGCILGWDFTSANIDGNHPQGGFKIHLINGDCECNALSGGGFSASYDPYTTTLQTGQVGGPATGSFPDLLASAANLWSFICQQKNPGSTYPNADLTWGTFVDAVGTYVMQPGNNPIGVTSWPIDWDVNVSPTPVSGHILVHIPGQVQANALTRINMFDPQTGAPVAEITGQGLSDYDLDLSELPDGEYTIDLEFPPGFSLRTGIIKSTTPN